MKNGNINFAILMFTFFLMFIIISCVSYFSENSNEKEVNIVRTGLNFHNYMENIKSKEESFNIKNRNILMIYCDILGNCKFNRKTIDLTEIKLEVKRLLKSHVDSLHLPELKKRDFDNLGSLHLPTNFLIAAKYHKELPYNYYFKIRNEVLEGYNEVREELSILNFNIRLNKLIKSDEKKCIEMVNEIYSAYPISYLEILE